MTKQVIICVDDEITVLSSIRAELKEAIGNNYLIEIAESGEEALEIIEELLENRHEIVLIISDQIMPGMKGNELLKFVHQISPKALKIMLTGQADLNAVTSAINSANLYRYISKPWQPEDLRLMVKEAVNSYLRDKKIAEQNIKIRENENRLKQFLDAMPVGVFVADANGKPYYINSRAQQLLGKGLVPNTTSEQLREVYQVYREGSEQLYPKNDDILQRALKGEKATADDVEIHQEDKVIPLEVWGTPIYDNKGNQIYAIAAFQDITERKKAESERNRLIEELFELNCNLELALEAELKLIESARRFVPDEFLSLLGHKSLVDVKLGEAVQREMSILFADIRNFTALSESMTPQDNFEFINTYLSCMEPAIAENQGFIDKYIGDAIMALFSGCADDAVKAGIAMLQRLADYNQHRVNSGDVPIKIGIGINTGSSILGTVGGQNRMDGTVIGDAVNLASRLESLTKTYRVPLLISHYTFFQLQDANQYAFRPIGRLKVKGKSELISVFEIFDAAPPHLKAAKLATKTMFEQALLLYYQGLLHEAAKTFESVLNINPKDRVAQIYRDRCQMKAEV